MAEGDSMSPVFGPRSADDILLEVVIEGEPSSKGRPRVVQRNGRTRAYSPSAAEEEVVAWHVRLAYKRAPDDATAFGVIAEFHMSDWRKQDVDNMLKLVLDACTGLVWKDDSQVSEVAGRVFRGMASPRTLFTIYRSYAATHPTVACNVCEAPIKTYKSQRPPKYCSPECRKVGRARPVYRECRLCDAEFSVDRTSRGRLSKDAFCSEACQRASFVAAKARRRVDLMCVRCGIAFNKPRSQAPTHGRAFCTAACRNDYWRDHRKAASRGVCSRCGGSTSKKTYTCCIGCVKRPTGLNRQVRLGTVEKAIQDASRSVHART